MFSAYCEIQETNVLMGPSRIRSFRNTEAGPTFLYQCICGEDGVFRSRPHAGSPVASHRGTHEALVA